MRNSARGTQSSYSVSLIKFLQICFLLLVVPFSQTSFPALEDSICVFCVNPVSGSELSSSVSPQNLDTHVSQSEMASNSTQPLHQTESAASSIKTLPVVVTLLNEGGSFRKLHPKGRSNFIEDLKSIIGPGFVAKLASRCDFFIHPASPEQKTQLLGLSAVKKWEIKCSLTKSESQEVRGVIFQVDTSYTKEFLMDELADQGVIDVRRRFIKDGEGMEEATTIVTLVFKQNLELPKDVKISYEVFRVAKFSPRPKQCMNCWDYGHPGTLNNPCHRPKLCRRCGLTHSDPCSNPMRCINCNGTDHEAGTRKCSIFRERVEAMEIASARGLDLGEALSEVRKKNPTVCVTRQITIPQLHVERGNSHNLDKEVAELKNNFRKLLSGEIQIDLSLNDQLTKLDERIDSMASSVQSLAEKVEPLAETVNVKLSMIEEWMQCIGERVNPEAAARIKATSMVPATSSSTQLGCYQDQHSPEVSKKNSGKTKTTPYALRDSSNRLKPAGNGNSNHPVSTLPSLDVPLPSRLRSLSRERSTGVLQFSSSLANPPHPKPPDTGPDLRPTDADV